MVGQVQAVNLCQGPIIFGASSGNLCPVVERILRVNLQPGVIAFNQHVLLPESCHLQCLSAPGRVFQNHGLVLVTELPLS